MEIEKELGEAREALAHAEGRPAEVYSRIVGYYRSVRNWNKGKLEEYEERKVFCLSPEAAPPALWPQDAEAADAAVPANRLADREKRLLLFIRPACPACPGAKSAATRLGIPVDLVDADTEDGMAEARRRQVFSTPTAILLTQDGQEVGRALDALTISKLVG
jgi:ribonucleoside-triphosphate reductase